MDSSGHEVARFGLTGHARDLSWGVLRTLEDGLAPWFGQVDGEAMTTTYEVWVTREDSLWVADVRGLRHLLGATDVEHFADLDQEVRD